MSSSSSGMICAVRASSSPRSRPERWRAPWSAAMTAQRRLAASSQKGRREGSAAGRSPPAARRAGRGRRPPARGSRSASRARRASRDRHADRPGRELPVEHGRDGVVLHHQVPGPEVIVAEDGRYRRQGMSLQRGKPPFQDRPRCAGGVEACAHGADELHAGIGGRISEKGEVAARRHDAVDARHLAPGMADECRVAALGRGLPGEAEGGRGPRRRDA
jgi:hypothetical protein